MGEGECNLLLGNNGKSVAGTVAVHWLVNRWVGWFFFKIGDNRAYTNSDGKELEEEEHSEALDHSMPQDP